MRKATDRVIVRLFRLIEGEAEGRFAITALVFVMVLALLVFWMRP